MTLGKTLLCVVVAVICFHYGHGQGFLCLVPKEIHAGRDFNMAFTLHEVANNVPRVDIQVMVLLKRKNSKEVTIARNSYYVSEDYFERSFIVQSVGRLSIAEEFLDWSLIRTSCSHSTRTSYIFARSMQTFQKIPRQIPQDLTGDSFKVRLQLSGGISNTFNRVLILNRNQTVIMVQTDKNIYKPGQTVKFRIVNIDTNQRPVAQKLSVLIVNPALSKLERFDNLTTTGGVIARQFSLSDYASLGTWNIQVVDSELNILHTAPFSVEEFVLPKFSVDVTLEPNFIIWGQGENPTVIVKSIYTYGKPVQGNCKIKVLGAPGGSNSEYNQAIDPNSGTAEFTDMNWASLAGSSRPLSSRMLTIIAEVSDQTGRMETGKAVINIYGSPYKLEILPSSEMVLRSGLTSVFYIRLGDHMGNLITDKDVKIAIHRESFQGSSESAVAVLRMRKGEPFIRFEYRHTAVTDEDTYTITASLTDEPQVKVTEELTTYKSYEDGLIHITRLGDLNKDIEKGLQEEFKVDVNEVASDRVSLSYIVVSQGNILEAGNVIDKKITLTPTIEMCPDSRLVVYMIQPGTKGQNQYEVVADYIKMMPTKCLDKRVSVKFDAIETRIGASTKMNAEVESWDGTRASPMPGVYDIFYMAVDRSIVLLQGNTAMDQEKVLSGLDSLNLFVDMGFSRFMTSGSIFRHLHLDTLNENVTSYNNVEIEVLDDEPMFAMAGGNRPVFRKTSDVDSAVEAINNEEEDVKTKDPASSTNTQIRKDFPDTWLWGSMRTEANGKASETVTLPDTITTWEVSAFGVNDEGLAYSAPPFGLVGFQPFFLSMNLPYSIKRGEIFSLRITVFNYRTDDVECDVRLKQSPMFAILDGQSKSGWSEINIPIKAGVANSVTFQINATKIGEIELEAVAEDRADKQKDQVKRSLIVKPEGVERMGAITSVLQLSDDTPLTNVFDINWPQEGVVPDSQRVQVKVTGETFGQALEGLEKLVTQPYGCGEQNMISTVPNIYGLKYIRNTNQRGMEETEEKLKANMKKGYAREIDNYKHPDGSYSAWGPSQDDPGSTWLTAFVLKSFAHASDFMAVDNDVLKDSISFISGKISPSGQVIESGKVLHSEIQTGTGQGVGMSIYCLLSILEAKETLMIDTMESQIPILINYVLSRQSEIEQNKFLSAMMAYALSLIPENSNYPNFKDNLDNLMAKLGDSEQLWSPNLETKSSDGHHSYVPPRTSLELQTAAYVLLAYTKQNLINEAMQLMKWIQSQQNGYGGFVSTQDTVLVLQALAEIGELIQSTNKPGSVVVNVPSANVMQELDISGGRAILLQNVDVPAAVNSVNVTLKGTQGSMAIVKVVFYYNSFLDEPTPTATKSLELKSLSFKKRNNLHQVQGCFKSNLPETTEMYVLEMAMPSGEIPVDTESELLRKNKGTTRVEIQKDKLNFYMDKIPSEGMCVRCDIESETNFDVQLPGDMKVYSYYQPEELEEAPIVLEGGALCETDPCDSDSATPLTSFFLSVVICTITSLLLCV